MAGRNEGKTWSLRVFSGQGNIQGEGRPKERVVGRSRKNHQYLWLGVLGPRREATACAWRPHHTTPYHPPALQRQEVRCPLAGSAGASHVRTGLIASLSGHKGPPALRSSTSPSLSSVRGCGRGPLRHRTHQHNLLAS